MPEKKAKEFSDKDKWMKYCMGSSAMKKEFSGRKQRIAVCLRKWRDRNKGGK